MFAYRAPFTIPFAEDYDLDVDLAKRRKEREENSSEGSESEPSEEWDSSGSDVTSESGLEDDDEKKKEKKEKKVCGVVFYLCCDFPRRRLISQ